MYYKSFSFFFFGHTLLTMCTQHTHHFVIMKSEPILGKFQNGIYSQMNDADIFFFLLFYFVLFLYFNWNLFEFWLNASFTKTIAFIFEMYFFFEWKAFGLFYHWNERKREKQKQMTIISMFFFSSKEHHSAAIEYLYFVAFLSFVHCFFLHS